MHIGIDCRLPYYQMGGISQYTLFLIKALAEQAPAGYRFSILHSRKDERDHTPAGRAEFQRGQLWTPCHHRLERWTLGAEIAPRRFDLWHSPDFIPPAWGAPRRVITVHDLNFWHYPQFMTADSRRYYLDQIRWAVAAADRISADSEYTRQELIDLLDVPPEKVTTIHLAANPVYTVAPTAAAITVAMEKYNLPAGFLLYVGTLEPRKNVPTLLRAYAQLRAEAGVTVPLVLVGRRGWLYDEIFDTITALNLVDQVRQLENVTNAELACLYRQAGVLALPSHFEGFGLPPLEAMHGGCPVVVSDRASLPEVVGPAGILLPPDDVTAWADALNRVLHEGELRAGMIARGHEQARKFTWAATAQATLALYDAARMDS